MSEPRLILYHKHGTSARTRFLRLAHGGVCGPDALPAGAELGADEAPAVLTHPAMLLRAAEERFHLPRGSLEPDGGFRCSVSDDGETTEVHLAHFTAIDPPFAAVDAEGACFIDLTQARGLPAVELALLRRAYEHVLG
ncbi:MAG: hypothetical protein K9M02_11780 [Thiohalocapsa sp.]|jgi:hypothetical protein|nr:hypothetical protein [Thiohalocapsa sp.]